MNSARDSFDGGFRTASGRASLHDDPVPADPVRALAGQGFVRLEPGQWLALAGITAGEAERWRPG